MSPLSSCAVISRPSRSAAAPCGSFCRASIIRLMAASRGRNCSAIRRSRRRMRMPPVIGRTSRMLNWLMSKPVFMVSATRLITSSVSAENMVPAMIRRVSALMSAPTSTTPPGGTASHLA